jgi:hypothetical protein
MAYHKKYKRNRKKNLAAKFPWKNKRLRSRTELVVARTLDSYDAEYEPTRFQLTVPATYVPDFYLKKLDLWIEVKGVFDLDGRRKTETFAFDHNVLVILQKRGTKMERAVKTNEAWLREVGIAYTYATCKYGEETTALRDFVQSFYDGLAIGKTTHEQLEAIVNSQANGLL